MPRSFSPEAMTVFDQAARARSDELAATAQRKDAYNAIRDFIGLSPRQWYCYTIGAELDVKKQGISSIVTVRGLSGRVALGAEISFPAHSGPPLPDGEKYFAEHYPLTPNSKPGARKFLVDARAEHMAIVLSRAALGDGRLTIVDMPEAAEYVSNDMVVTPAELYDAWQEAHDTKALY